MIQKDLKKEKVRSAGTVLKTGAACGRRLTALALSLVLMTGSPAAAFSAEQELIPEDLYELTLSEELLPSDSVVEEMTEEAVMPEIQPEEDIIDEFMQEDLSEAGSDEDELILDEDPELMEEMSEQGLFAEGETNLPAGPEDLMLIEEEVLTDAWVNPVYENVVSEEDLLPDEEGLLTGEADADRLARETADALEEGLAVTGTKEAAVDLYAGETDPSGDEQIVEGEETITFDAEDILENQGYFLTSQIGPLSAEIKPRLKSRTTLFTLGLMGDVTTNGALTAAKAALEKAMEHTGVPTEGDYIRYQIGGTYSTLHKYSYGSTRFYIATFTMHYYTTAAQEAVMDAAVKNLLPSLKNAGADAYSRTKAAYGYLTKNVAFDMRGYTNPNYLTMYTGYAALVDKKAVCQGYSVALYRLLLEMGIDCRVIGGTGVSGSETEEHAWNIVRLGNKYFNVDATWDAGKAQTKYQWFLKGDTAGEFGSWHVRDKEYKTGVFYSAYPMSTSSWSGKAGSECPVHGTHTPVFAAAQAAGCESIGHTAGTVCSSCGMTLSGREPIPSTGHAYTGWNATGSAYMVTGRSLIGGKAETFFEVQYVRTCMRCGTMQHQYEEQAPFITLNVTKKTITLRRKKTKKLKVGMAIGDKVVSFKSSKPKIVSVSKSGKLKARKKGKAKITVRLLSGLKKSFWVKVK